MMNVCVYFYVICYFIYLITKLLNIYIKYEIPYSLKLLTTTIFVVSEAPTKYYTLTIYLYVVMYKVAYINERFYLRNYTAF